MAERIKRVVVTVDLEDGSEARPPRPFFTSAAKAADRDELIKLYQALADDLALWRKEHPQQEPIDNDGSAPIVRKLHGVAIKYMGENQDPPYDFGDAAAAEMNQILEETFPNEPEWRLANQQAIALMVLMRHDRFLSLAPYSPTQQRAW